MVPLVVGAKSEKVQNGTKAIGYDGDQPWTKSHEHPVSNKQGGDGNRQPSQFGSSCEK